MKRFSLFLVSLFMLAALAACSKAPKNDTPPQGMYTGTIPCADCAGIKYAITFNPDGTVVDTVWKDRWCISFRNGYLENGERHCYSDFPVRHEILHCQITGCNRNDEQGRKTFRIDGRSIYAEEGTAQSRFRLFRTLQNVRRQYVEWQYANADHSWEC